MRQVLSSYKGDHKSIYLVFIGDIHMGNRYFRRHHLDQALDFVRRNRARCRIILMGDILELATKQSVGRSVYDETYHTGDQFEMAVAIFKEFADIIDLVIEGNHEERIIRDTSFEIIEEFCHRIGRVDAYGKFSSLLNVQMGSGLVYTTFAWHGAGGGTTEAAAQRYLLDMRHRATAHIYAMGHTHKLFGVPKKVFVPNVTGDEPIEMDQLFVNTGTALGFGGYGEQKGFQACKEGYGAVQIFSDSRKMRFHYIEDLVS